MHLRTKLSYILQGLWSTAVYEVLNPWESLMRTGWIASSFSVPEYLGSSSQVRHIIYSELVSVQMMITLYFMSHLFDLAFIFFLEQWILRLNASWNDWATILCWIFRPPACASEHTTEFRARSRFAAASIRFAPHSWSAHLAWLASFDACSTYDCRPWTNTAAESGGASMDEHKHAPSHAIQEAHARTARMQISITSVVL